MSTEYISLIWVIVDGVNILSAVVWIRIFLTTLKIYITYYPSRSYRPKNIFSIVNYQLYDKVECLRCNELYLNVLVLHAILA